MVELQDCQFENERNLLIMQVQVKEETLETISREIHDNIGQRLSLAKLHLTTSFPFSNPLQNDKISAASQLLSGTIFELRDLSKTLSSEFISHHGLCKVIEIEAKQLIKLTNYEIEYKVLGEQVFLMPYKELVAFRVFQEALNNIIKHSECRKIEIVINYQCEFVELIINDDGKGFNNALSIIEHGSGIQNMEKRASLIEGTIRIKNALPSGTSLILKIPFDGQKN